MMEFKREMEEERIMNIDMSTLSYMSGSIYSFVPFCVSCLVAEEHAVQTSETPSTAAYGCVGPLSGEACLHLHARLQKCVCVLADCPV
jgi:hypothetical protein